MHSFELPVASNITTVDGTIDGFFGVGSAGMKQCLKRLKKADRANRRCIPIIAEEFQLGTMLEMAIGRNKDRIPGVVTLGRKENDGMPLMTHLAVVCRSIASDDPNFVAVMCGWEDGLSKSEWLHEAKLMDLHMKFGSLAVENGVCTIQVDNDVPPLPAPRF